MEPRVAHLAYGKQRIPLKMDPGLADWHVIAPCDEDPLPDQRPAFIDACWRPVGSRPLQEVVRPSDRVTIVTSDGTRAVPNHLLIPWLLEQLPIPEERITVLLGNGTHRPNTPEEIAGMFGEEVARRVRIVNHDAFDPEKNVGLGTTPAGAPAWLDKAYVEADRRIVVGFIEPHFAAGFSGGAKGVAPGVTGIESIFYLHSYELLAHPKSTWGVLDDNPLQKAILDMVAPCPPDFLINVTLNSEKEITGYCVGDYYAAHREGCARVRERAMVPVPHEFPIVIMSNSGYPLDQNLYQTVKGMSAAARIVQDGGTIIVASECSDGVPSHGNFGRMLGEADSAEALDEAVRALPEPKLDQWQVQLFAQVVKRCNVALYSSIDKETTEASLMTAVDDLDAAVEECIRRVGEGAPVAVLPEGPITVPYVR